MKRIRAYSCLRKLILVMALLLLPMAFAAQMLENGSSGETVQVLSGRLCALGYLDNSTDQYDDQVANAVMDFQKANGLPVTGEVDVSTQQKLYAEEAVPRSDYLMEYVRRYAGTNLSIGDSGPEVRSLQEALSRLGYYPSSADGSFGEATRGAVLTFQKACGIEQTGLGDAPTLTRLYEGTPMTFEEYMQSQCVRRGDSGAAVRNTQMRLADLKFYSGDMTGTFGDNTMTAVRLFQEKNGIPVSGSVDEMTFACLFSEDALAAEPGTIFPGDSGETLFQIQQILMEKGYLEFQTDEVYDWDTQSAVMLYCAANGLPISMGITPTLQAAILSGEGKSISALDDSAFGMSAQKLAAVCDAAVSLNGVSFWNGSEGYFPGYSMTRYVFASQGVNIGSVPDVLGRIGNQENTASRMSAGDVVVLSRGQDDNLLLNFGICVWDGTIVTVDPDSGVVVTIDLNQMDYQFAYVWNLG